MAGEETLFSRRIRLDLGERGVSFERAEIRFTGIEQAGPSFEGRVFLNHAAADMNTPTTAENGYAGSFHVYGYGIWPEDVGKEPAERLAEAGRTRAPIEKVLIATEAVRAVAARGPEVTVTVVPVYAGAPARTAGDALKLESIQIIIKY